MSVPERPVPGVNLVGFLEAESGLGEVARRLAVSLESSGIPTAPIAYRGTHGRQEHPLSLRLADEAPYDTNIICLGGRDLTSFVDRVGSEFFARRYSIGVWFWETTVWSPDERSATRFLDELWVASEYVRDTVADESDIPVHVMPVPVEAPAGPLRSRADLDLPDGFTFLFVFDFWSAERKNPGAVVEAFMQAFRPAEGPSLVLKSINGHDWKPRQLEALVKLGAGRPDIVVRDGYVSARERDSYIAACDCYVSLHRSEGLGLTMAEAMACGKPVIATGYSGNLEFMSELNSRLVPYVLVDVPDTWWAHAPGARWAEPDVAVAARSMRDAWENADELRSLGARARAEILDRFSPARTAGFVAARLADAEVARTARASVHDVRPPILEASRDLDRMGLGDSLAHEPISRPTWPFRKLLRRALWPHLEDQHRFQSDVLDVLTTLHRSVEELERRILMLEGASESAESDSTPPNPGRSRP